MTQLPAPLVQPVVIGSCSLYLGDYRDFIGGFPSSAVVITDPPYGNDFRPKKNRDRLVSPDRDFKPIHGNAVPFDPSALLRFDRIILWGGNYFADKLPASSKWLVWDKREDTTPDDGADAEMAWTNLKGPTRIHRQLWRGICRRGEENVSRGARKLHPNQKPVALMDFCLDQAGVTMDDIVVDTHAGCSPLGVACFRRGITYHGIDLDPEHFQTACERLLKEQQQGRLCV